jgi:hypothetical protein
MYTGMSSLGEPSPVILRGVALHKVGRAGGRAGRRAGGRAGGDRQHWMDGPPLGDSRIGRETVDLVDEVTQGGQLT